MIEADILVEDDDDVLDRRLRSMLSRHGSAPPSVVKIVLAVRAANFVFQVREGLADMRFCSRR